MCYMCLSMIYNGMNTWVYERVVPILESIYDIVYQSPRMRLEPATNSLSTLASISSMD